MKCKSCKQELIQDEHGLFCNNSECKLRNVDLTELPKDSVPIPSNTLIRDIQNIYKKYYDRSRVMLLTYYWEFGARLNQEWGKPNLAPGSRQVGRIEEKAKKGHFQFLQLEGTERQLIKELAQRGIKSNRKDMGYARKFAVQYPEIATIVEQQEMSWTKIKQSLMMAKEKKQITYKSDMFKVFKEWRKVNSVFLEKAPLVQFENVEDKTQCLSVLKAEQKRLQQVINRLEKQ